LTGNLNAYNQIGRRVLHVHSYLQKFGIHHGISCPHTHGQDGVAESKFFVLGICFRYFCSFNQSNAHASSILQFLEDFLCTIYLLLRLLGSLYQLQIEDITKKMARMTSTEVYKIK